MRKSKDRYSISSSNGGHARFDTEVKFDDLREKFQLTKSHFQLLKKRKNRKFGVKVNRKYTQANEEAMKKVKLLVKISLINFRWQQVQITLNHSHLMAMLNMAF